MNHHLANLLRRRPELEYCAADITSAFDRFLLAFVSGHKLLLCGNGGSASDAEHWAGELLKGFIHRRALPSHLTAGLSSETADNLQWALPAIPLTGFPALSTAFANDIHPDFIFAQLVWGLGRSGDVLVALSTSGNSRNVCRAAEVARHLQLPVVALTGRDGGSLKNLADICIAVPASETYLVQEFHLPIYHCLSLMLEEEWAQRMSEPQPQP
ncbi:SIS domain-containing protein [soil metagenome]